MTSPGEAIRSMLEEKGWTQEELGFITGFSRKTIMNLISGRSGITPDMAVALGKAFGNNPAWWMRLQTDQQLSLAQEEISDDIERRARLFGLAPISDMQRRGWISETKELDKLESELRRFFGTESLIEPAELPATVFKGKSITQLNPAERAWCFRARQLAANIVVPSFSQKKLDAIEPKLRQLAAYPKEIRHLPKILSEFGLRFVIVEPLPGVKIDGATFWIDKSPVIAMTVRYDRIDGFWFTLMHELAHVRNGDALAVDRDLIDGMTGLIVVLEEDEAERRANEHASTALIPANEMESFIRRVGPLYSKERVIQFAHRMKIHPGIIVGQLQHRREIGYSALRDLLVKVRGVITATALTDGWDQATSTVR